jgi:hypothetical protein
MPELTALAVLLAAAARHLNMRPISIEALEGCLLRPRRHEHQLSVLLSRLLIRDKALRDKLHKGELGGFRAAFCCAGGGDRESTAGVRPPLQ